MKVFTYFLIILEHGFELFLICDEAGLNYIQFYSKFFEAYLAQGRLLLLLRGLKSIEFCSELLKKFLFFLLKELLELVCAGLFYLRDIVLYWQPRLGLRGKIFELALVFVQDTSVRGKLFVQVLEKV